MQDLTPARSAAAPAVAAALVVLAFSSGPTGDDRTTARAAVIPDWFWPIWDAYDRNPAISPEFDFASLYSATRR
jgi:hypothetical protein